ncbi:hypothetical protein N5580_13100 [Pantoea piersonii]|uniref:Phage capsid protein n=1 Tax=Pantoea piersonii TaxID=2364647 RepID=A0AAJ5U8T9_9GAMM|nr:hypothetical protein [Pantoea piersonii]WBG90023.1 hypothetical protein N5580_13100 [Pantoea piersonii]
MAIIGNNCLTLADWAKRQDPDMKQARIIEMLNQKNPILLDMPFLESNAATHHRTTVRTSLPAAEWRRINKGVGKGKSTTAQVDEAVAILETYSEVDKELADLAGNTNAFRLSEAQAFIEGMNQQMASTLIYGNKATNPASFDGFATRYNDKDAENGKNIIDAGGTGNNLTSIYIVGWGEQTVHGLYPKGSKAGLSHQDKGQVTLLDADGNQYEGYRDHFQWKTGLAVRDWRYVVRIANIDVTKMLDEKANGKFATDLVRLMIAATHILPDRSARMGIYMNRTLGGFFDMQAVEKPSLGLSVIKDTEGRPWTDFRGMPFREIDAIKDNETVVS